MREEQEQEWEIKGTRKEQVASGEQGQEEMINLGNVPKLSEEFRFLTYKKK